ncbi:putative nuclear mRNA splicing factor-associated protein [Sodiomyces alkalinus F11]|uniref:Putative nuclear mRNA splicing factor-associated protein n=1 Tax=Sodiomyces alkalinus (strain CBS 110278 / VKM F-3762 / F11) TaxID=1314773 RepID=A0A3N2PS91_SODAK|nr:putative nuclear mRNA splicing factor-associated protein [Sodiomyces alkalinus F11]ROT37365.1 putative nuclear mRNA splicing factor-associated protein [Sodiomyces alkalinus F11]
MAEIQPPLPTSVDKFDQDDRISYSTLDNKYLAVHDDGTEFEFNAATGQWVLAEEEALHGDEAQHHALIGEAQGEDDTTSRKRKEPSHESEEGNSSTKKKIGRPAKKARQPPQPRQNTAVYVTGLPPDATAEEVHEVFSRKAGVIAEEIDSGRPRIKMYTDSEGRFKGDALVVFFKPQSVDMAIMLLDDTDFRISSSGLGSGKIRVQAADSSYKKMRYDADADGGDGNSGGANGNGEGNGKANNGGEDRQNRARGNDRERQRIIKKTQKMAARLADWSDDEPSSLAMPGAAGGSSRWNKVVILKQMFTLEELDEDPAALLEIKEDVREECAKLGTVTNVVLYDEEPEGIVSVKFREPESAEACVQLMHGRSFDGRTVEASIATGRERYRKSNKKSQDEHGSDPE